MNNDDPQGVQDSDGNRPPRLQLNQDLNQVGSPRNNVPDMDEPMNSGDGATGGIDENFNLDDVDLTEQMRIYEQLQRAKNQPTVTTVPYAYGYQPEVESNYIQGGQAENYEGQNDVNMAGQNDVDYDPDKNDNEMNANWDLSDHPDQGHAEEEMLVNEEIEEDIQQELNNPSQTIETLYYSEKPQSQTTNQVLMKVPNFSSGYCKQALALSDEQCWARLEELGKVISKAIESKTEPIKDFDEHSTLVERHHEFILARLLALGEKPAAIPELEGEPTAEQIEEHKLKCEEVAKEYQARCEKRDNWMKDAFEMPAYWVLEEKILMKYEYLQEIFRFFRGLIVYFFPRMMEVPTFAKIIDDILNTNTKSLYSAINYKKSQRSGFSTQLSESDLKKKDMIDKMNALTEMYENSRIFVEQEWRENLKPGQYIDAINLYPTPSNVNNEHNIKGWCPGKVTQIKDGKVQVAFLGMSVRQQTLYKLDSLYIAPHGTFTNDFDVRYKLKPGDEFDCCDDYGIWYKSTVKRIYNDGKEIDIDGNPVIKAHIAFRFKDPEGQKVDNDGNKVTGFLLDKFDMQHFLSSPSIMPFASMSYYYTDIKANTMKCELEITNDISDTIIPSKTIKEWATGREAYFSGLKCIATFLNEFGQKQGFEAILKFFNKIKSGEFDADYQHILYIHNFLVRTIPLWKRQFVCQYTPDAATAYIEAVTGPESLMNKQFSKEHMNQLVNSLSGLLRRYYVPAKYQSMVNYLNTAIGSTLLASKNLEKRIQGVKMIVDQIKEARTNSYHVRNAEVNREETQSYRLVRDLMQLNFFESVFAPGKFHLQICQRANDVFKIYAHENMLTDQHMDMLYDAASKDEASKIEVYKMFADCANYLDDSLITKFVNRLNNVEGHLYQARDIDLIFNFARASYKGTDAKESAILFLYRIATNQKPGIAMQLLKPARKHLQDLLKNVSHDLKVNYICMCIDRLADENVSSVQSLKIFMNLIKSMPKYNYNKLDSKMQQKEFVQELVNNHNLFGNLITDLRLYKQRVVAYLTEAEALHQKEKKVKHDAKFCAEQELQDAELFEEGFTHAQNLQARLKAILFILEVCEGLEQLQRDQLQQLWEILTVNKVIDSDQEYFFKFFKIILNEKNWIDTGVICEFFETKIQGNADLLANIQMETFNCIQIMFLIINESQNSLNIISRPKDESKFSSVKQHSETDPSKKIKLEIRVHLPPSQLTGINVLWDMFRQTNRSQDLDLQANIIYFLALVHQSLSRLLWSRKKEIYHQFTTECLQNINDVVSDPHQHISVKEELVKNTMYMLKEFFQASEKRGTANIRPHCTLQIPNRVFKNILIVCLIATSSTPKYLVLSVSSQMTVWELLDLIAKKQNRSPLKIRLQRDSKKQEITIFDFCKSLHELKFEDNEEINIVKPIDTAGKVPLINPQTGQLVREVEEIFGEWFDRFSLPADNFVDYENNSEPRYMTKQMCVEFLQHTVAELSNQVSKQFHNFEENKSINELFSIYDSDLDGRLTKADFLKFYTDKSNSAPDKVWQNLIQHEIGKDLLPCPKKEVTYENDVNVVRDQTELPRYLISSNPETINFLFNLGQQLESQSHSHTSQKGKEAIWKLITSLKTNPHLYLQLLRNQNVTEMLLPTDSVVPIHKLLYMLQIMQNFVNFYSKFGEDVTSQVAVKSYYDKKVSKKWGSELQNEKDFPPLSEKEQAAKKFGHLQMSAQGSHQGDNNPPALETIEEAREQDTYQRPTRDRNFEGDHWKQPNRTNVLPSGNNAIALPAADPQDQTGSGGKSSNDTFKYESDKKDTYYRQMVNQWKGDTQDETFDCELFSTQELIQLMMAERGIDEPMEGEDKEAQLNAQSVAAMMELDDLKKNWAIVFIKNDGFKVLLSIMESIVSKYINTEANDTLVQSAEVEVLQIVTYMIRVILQCSFCAQTQDIALSNSLQRKMSSVKDHDMLEKEAKPKEKENQHAAKQAVITQQYQELINLLVEEETTARDLLAQVDLPKLQQVLEVTFAIILRKQHQSSNAEKSIVTECLNIFISCVSFNADLLNRVFTQQNIDGRFYSTFIRQGLLGDSIILRAQFKDALLFIADNVKHHNLAQLPVIFFLENLIKALEDIKSIKSRSTSQFFQLLTKLIGKFFMVEQLIAVPESFKQLIEPVAFTKRVLESLNSYESEETKNSLTTDFTLVGLLKLSRSLLLLKPGLLSSHECGQILNMLVTQFLFNQNSDNYKGHIRKNTIQSQQQKGSTNKCHTMKSREQAYSLMDAIISTNPDPQIIDQLVETFWAPFIMQLNLQKDNHNYNPEENNRASSGFVGIKNLGCICYMNSVIQQMFNVPAFRYSLLASDSREPLETVEHEGRQIVDQSLYQWMRMFSFLMLSDRREYNPKDFCFAHKQPGGAPTNVRVQMDAQEFINVGFERLENALKKTPQKYLMQNTFQGQTASLTICRSCGNITQNDEDFYCLTLNVRGKKTLYNSLESMVTGEIIEDYKCGACNQKTEIEKKLAIKHLPNTLIVHLNRITFDIEQLRNIKINDKLEFPNTLNVKKYMVEEVHREQRRKIRERKLEQRRKDMQKQEESNENESDQKAEDSKQQEVIQERSEDKKEPDDEMKEETAEKVDEDDEEQDDRKLSNEDCEFKLVGVVIHMGVAEAGHYFSYINIERESDQTNYREWMQTNKQNWLQFNDSSVTPFDFSKLPFQCFGEDSSYGEQAAQSHNAYMLIYEKAIKQPMKIVCDEEIIKKIQQMPEQLVAHLDCPQSSLGCDSTAITRVSDSIVDDVTQLTLSSRQSLEASPDAAWLPHSYLIYPNILRRIRNNEVSFDEKAKEYYITVPFNQVDKFIPQELYTQVHQDNQLFLAEKQVICNAFFKTTAFLLQNVVKNTDTYGQEDFDMQQEKLQKVFKIIDKIIFEMIANGSEQKHLKEIQDLLFMVLDRSERSLIQLIEERILVGTKKVEDKKNQDKPFFDMLIFNKEQEVRELTERILTRATKYLYDRVQEQDEVAQEQLNTILDTIVAMMPLECMKAWHKLGAYFEYLYNLVKDGNQLAVSNLNERKTVSKLVGLVTKFKDQQAYETSVPPFDKLVLTISAIVRSQPLVIYLHGISELQQPTYEDITVEVNKLGYVSPYFTQCANAQFDAKPTYLTGDDLRAIMMVDKKPKEFYTLALKFTQQAKEVANLIGHICFNNYFVSKNIGKILLKGLNHVNEIELSPFLGPMGVFLTIDDQYQQQRIEWLLGIPDLKLERPMEPHLVNDPRFTIQKIGVQRIKDIEDVVFDYRSMLFKESNAYKETVMTIIYNYRREKFPKAMLIITDALFSAIANLDNKQMILKYLLACEPPSYAYRRFFDWIEPHFISQITKCSDNLQYHQEEFEMSMRILSTIEKLKKDFAPLFEIDNGNQQPDLGVCKVSDPYMVWNIVSEKVICQVMNQDQSIHAVLHELHVNITKSRPTGTFNESLTKVVRGNSVAFKPRTVAVKQQEPERLKWGERIRSKQEKQEMRAKRAKARQDRKNRAINDGDSDDNDDQEVNTFITDTGEQVEYKRVRDPTDEPQADVQPQSLPDDNEEVTNWQTNLNQMEDDIEFDRDVYAAESSIKEPVNQQDNQLDYGNRAHAETANERIWGTNENQPPSNIPWPSQAAARHNIHGGSGEVCEDQKANGQDGDSDECFKANYEDDEPDVEHQPPAIENVQMQEQNVDEPQVLGCVMALVVRNFNRYQTKHFRVEFPNELRQFMNFHVPSTEMCFKVPKTTDRSCLTFQKKRLNEEWGPVDEISIVVEDVAFDGTQSFIYDRDYPELRAAKKALQEEALQQVAANAVELAQTTTLPADNVPTSSGAVDAGMKECPVCTYHNFKSARQCEICETPL